MVEALGLIPNKLDPVYTLLIGLGGKQVPIEEAANLTVELGDENMSRSLRNGGNYEKEIKRQ